MVLSDKDIFNYIAEDKLEFVTHDRSLPFNMYEQIQPSSIDLRLSNQIVKFKADVQAFDVRDLADIKNKIESITVQKNEPIVLKPNELIFCQTLEYLKMPTNCIGIVEGKSRFARLGLAVHSTGSYINPEFRGVMPLQIINHNSIPITIYPFISICQLLLIEIKNIPLIPYSERSDNPYYREQIAGFSTLHMDPAITDYIPEESLLKINQTKRKIDNYIRRIGENTADLTVDRLNSNENAKSIAIHINGGHISGLNLGHILGNVNSNLEHLNTKGDYDITKSIKELTLAISSSSLIQEELKIEFAEYLKLISEEAIKQKEERNYPVLKTIIKGLGQGLTQFANVAQIWDVYSVQILKFFEML